MSWRINIKDWLRSFAQPHLDHVYEFGVFSGESVYDIKNICDCNELHIEKFFCFDSFIGLPKETQEPIYQDCWNEGNFNSLERFQTDNIPECITKVKQVILDNSNFDDTDLIFIDGFFKDSLNKEIVQKHEMKPALIVDLDADLYSSTLEALEFICKNNLIVPGTLLLYDDWGGTPGWEHNLTGESRAHKEICDKYNLQTRQICQFGNCYPHVQTVFQVI